MQKWSRVVDFACILKWPHCVIWPENVTGNTGKVETPRGLRHGGQRQRVRPGQREHLRISGLKQSANDKPVSGTESQAPWGRSEERGEGQAGTRGKAEEEVGKEGGSMDLAYAGLIR